MNMIDVIQNDIESGERRSCTRCPVALALMRTLNTDDISVGQNFFVMGVTEIKLPLDVSKRIAEFDEFGIMEPFSFPISIPGNARPT